jgi:hypothetical protein
MFGWIFSFACAALVMWMLRHWVIVLFLIVLFGLVIPAFNTYVWEPFDIYVWPFVEDHAFLIIGTLWLICVYWCIKKIIEKTREQAEETARNQTFRPGDRNPWAR